MPVIGFLNFASPDGYRPMTAAFLIGLRESGYVEGETSRLNTDGPRHEAIACPRWRPI